MTVGFDHDHGLSASARPFISVVVTAYRRRTYLLEAVQSILSQDLGRSEFEVIVLKDFVDADIDSELAAASPTVRVHTEDLVRMGEMIARGVELAHGDVLCFLEDDDRFRPGKLRGLRELLHASPDLGFVRNSYLGIDAGGHAIPSWDRMRPQPPGSVRLPSDQSVDASLALTFRYGLCINLSTMTVRVDLVRPWLSLFREVPASPDLFVFLLAAIADRPMQIESDRWNEYRVHASTSHSALAETDGAKDLADTVRSEVTARVMEQVLVRAPGHLFAERFVTCFHREVSVTKFLLDPAARLSLGEWFGFLRTILWRRQRYLLALGAFAVYRSLNPRGAVRSYRRWRFRALRRGASQPG